MGGSIGFESVENAGSRFWVEVPFEPATRPEPVAAPTVQRSAAEPETPAENVIAFADPFRRHRARVRSMQVLIADDYAANRLVLQNLLQKAGHRVVAVEDGEAVLDALEVSDYDVVIVDLHMPGISGLDMLRELRVMEAGTGKSTPVLVLSADVTPESIRQCEEAGARAFIPKPIVATRLLDMLADVATTGKVGIAAKSVQPLAPADGDDVLDPHVLDELGAIGMGQAFETEFIEQCLSDARTCVRLLGEYGREERWEQMREQAHALKGVANNVGLVSVSSAGGEIMRLADWQLAREWNQRLMLLRGKLQQGEKALAARAETRARSSEQSN